MNAGPTISLPEPVYESVPRQFASWVAHTPDAPAVCQGARCWSYAELDASARVLARRLPPDETFAVSGRNSFGLVSTLLAVLSSRGVLLTIDPSLPAVRQQLLVTQGGARRLLFTGGQPPAADGLRQLPWADVIGVDPDTGRVTAGPAVGSELTDPRPDDPACIFFTSGTTGVPKGVLGCHKGLSHFLTWQRETFQVGPGDRVGQLTNLSFDAVLRAVFLPLVSGATLCLPPESVTWAGDSVLPWMDREGITLAHAVPSLAQAWLAAVPPAVTLRTLRRFFLAGEPLTDSFVQRWRARFPAAGPIVNLYGPTETTMVKFWYEVPPEPDPGVQPAGWPLPQTQALLFDDQGALCGPGEAGEIVLRTPYRTRGYINAPADQQKSFFPNPFRHDAADLLYRTGDRGRYRADGALEILGRLDQQVKIQGVRIEPDEVSAAMAGHPSVTACVVVARREPEREPVLVAYVVGDGLDAGQLREYLARRLPAAMVPAVMVFLDRLPLLSNGKVDRNALPPPPAPPPFLAPRTRLEQVLAELWRQALGVEKIGVADNFFELGGNSVHLTQVHAGLQEELHRPVPITLLFQHPTIRSLAENLSRPSSRQPPGRSAVQRAARQIAARMPPLEPQP